MASARVGYRRLILFVTVLAAMLVLAAACGDDESDSSTNDSEAASDTEQVESASEAPEPSPTEEQQSDENGMSNDSEPDDPAEQEGEQESVSQPQLQWDQPPEMQLKEGADYQAVLTTSHGQVVINLLDDEAPIAVNNFVFLAEQGYYSNVPFHRVINGFMIQTGDPTGTGRGGPGYQFQDEPISRDYAPGTVAMANAGPNTNGSQFFIVHGDMRGQLPKNYTIFGEVTEGMDVVDAIANVSVGRSPAGEMSSPTEDVFIESVEIKS